MRHIPAGGRALGPHFARVLATCGPYACFVGTARAGEDEWRRWFSFERYAPIGYPRNDVLYREPTAIDLANVDRATYERACATLAKGHRVLLYAPTFRDHRPDWIQHVGLDRLADAVARQGDLLLEAGLRLEAPEIAIAASAGMEVSPTIRASVRARDARARSSSVFTSLRPR